MSFINIEVKTKKCNVCGEVKSLNDFYSRGYGKKPDGERRVCYCCKVCKDKKRNEWFQMNKERVMKQQHERYIKDYEKNKEKYAAACRRYYLKNKVKILQRHRDNYRLSLGV